VTKKKAEKILKYKDLEKEMHRMWNVQTEVIPVIIGVRENIYISIRYYLEQHTGKALMKQELQNTAVTDNAHILSESTDVIVQNV